MQKDVSQLESDAQSVTGYGGDPPSSAAADESAAASAISNAVSTANSDIGAANGDMQAGTATATNLASPGGCPDPESYNTISTISA